MKDLAIFDFCETLIDYQTADKFVKYVLLDSKVKKSNFWMVASRFLSNKYFSIFVNKFFPKYNFGKRMVLLSLKGIKRDELETAASTYNQIIQNNRITPLFSKMKYHLKKNDHVIIISGGYDTYIKYFVKEHGLDYFCATKIKIKNDKCMGTFTSQDCMFDEKLKKVKEYINYKDLKFDRSIFYTDSKSDLKLMQWVDKGIVVSKNKPQQWASEFGFKELIWKSY